MAFVSSQLRQLKRRINPRNVKQREANGLTLNYIEGWHAIAEANRIFGFDGWDRVTLASQCVWAKPLANKYGAAYVTRIRVIVRAGEQRVIREGSGAGEATAASPGLAHEFAAKAAETDATKRALSTFGNMFGLSLYGGAGTFGNLRTRATEARSSDRQLRTARAPGSVPDPHDGKYPNMRPQEYPRIDQPLPTDTEVDPRTEAETERPPYAPWPEIDPFEEAVARAARTSRIDKSKLYRSEVQRLRDPGHLRYVGTHGCLVCGRKPSHAHHLRFAQPRALGRKVSDEFAVPLCNLHHREVHGWGDEKAWWQEKKLNPLAVAHELWSTRRHSEESTGFHAVSSKGELSASSDEVPDVEALPPPTI